MIDKKWNRDPGLPHLALLYAPVISPFLKAVHGNCQYILPWQVLGKSHDYLDSAVHWHVPGQAMRSTSAAKENSHVAYT